MRSRDARTVRRIRKTARTLSGRSSHGRSRNEPFSIQMLTSPTRPSNQQIDQLKTENTRLRRVLEDLQDGSSALHTRPRQHDAPPISLATPDSLPARPASEDSNFHGPSSAFFDGEQPLQVMKTTRNVTLGPVESNHLLGTTAKQRKP